MPKIDPEHSTARFAVRRHARSGRAILENRKTGKRLPLKGYGTLADKLIEGGDVDLTRPIYEQIMSAKKKAKARAARSSSGSSRRK